MPLISVIIVNYNSGEYLSKCLSHLFKQSFSDFEVLLVDNGSSDDSLRDLPKDKRLEVIKLEENTGFAKANNIGASKAKGEWLALLNPDAFAKENWLEELVAATKRHSDAAMFGSTQLNNDNPDIIDGCGDVYYAFGIPYRGNYGKSKELIPEEGEIFSPCAAAALYKREVFKRVGGFDEDFFCYCEDVDLGFRMRLLGEKAIQVKDAIVLHQGSGVTSKMSNFAEYHGARNRLWVFFKNMPLLLLIILLPFHILTELLLLIRSIFSLSFFTHIKGFIAGIFGLFRVIGKRFKIKRDVSICKVIGFLTWSPFKLLFRKSDVKI